MAKSAPAVEIEFLGAAQTVTGSRTLVYAGERRYLVDCGLFQGPKWIREKNWEPFPNPSLIDGIFLTHAHIDHSGYLPKIVQEGFRGPIYASEATLDLCKILLLDSAHLQEEDARFLNRRKATRHHPALPLYTERDAQNAIELLTPLKKNMWHEMSPDLGVHLSRSGHILGSTFIQFSFGGGNGVKTLTFSGDIGNNRQHVIKGPEVIRETDYLVMEATYGDRLQPRVDVLTEFEQVICRTLERGGVVVIPAFAVGRTQEVLYLLRVLEDEKRIPEVPVYVDSPMANNSTDIYLKHSDDLRLYFHDGKLESPLCPKCFEAVRTVDESMLVTMKDGPMIVISAAGMLTGGRVLHHLKKRLPDARNTLLFVGYQVEETKGRLLQQGLPKIRIHKELVDVEAEVVSLSSLSAHGDSQDIIDWLSQLQRKPKRIFLNHGELQALRALQYRIKTELKMNVVIPVHGEKFVLD